MLRNVDPKYDVTLRMNDDDDDDDNNNNNNNNTN
jgi:hypothetical protein